LGVGFKSSKRKCCCPGTLDHGPLKQGARLQQCRCRVARFCNGRHRVGRRCNVDFRTWRVRYGQCLGAPHASACAAQRHHRLRDHLEQPRWQRGERSGQLRAAVGRGIGWPTPLAREHHGDEHLEPLHTSASVSVTAGQRRTLGPCRAVYERCPTRRPRPRPAGLCTGRCKGGTTSKKRRPGFNLSQRTIRGRRTAVRADAAAASQVRPCRSVRR
jgi:hypothetical protein